MFRPTTLSGAFGLARLQEEEVGRKHRPMRNLNTNHNNHTPTNTYLPAYPRQAPLRLPAPNPLPKFPAPPNLSQYNQTFPKKYPLPIKRLTTSQMQERMDKRLCYNCDEKYHLGHKCNKPKLYLLEGVDIGGGLKET